MTDFFYYLNLGQFASNWWITILSLWYILGSLSFIFHLENQIKSNTWLRNFIETSNAAWMYISFIVIPFLIIIFIQAIYRSLFW